MRMRSLAVTAVLIAGTVPARSSCGGPLKDPDCVAWSFFAANSAAAGEGIRSTKWETWISAKTLFAGPEPVWPRQTPPIELEELLQLTMEAEGGTDLRPAAHPMPPDGERSEVRLNRYAFDYIYRRRLWSKQGLLDFLFEGKHKVDFPKRALEVKAVWRPIGEGDKPKYHWQLTSDHRLIGLLAIHVSSKALPNWLWGTWIHDSVNLEAAGYKRCPLDRFGYPDGPDMPMSKGLRKMFDAAGLGPEWNHYRLIGTQTQYAIRNQDVVLQNPRIENAFNGDSSCMSCHAMARARPTGVLDFCNPSATGCKPIVGEPKPEWLRGTALLDFAWVFGRAK